MESNKELVEHLKVIGVLRSINIEKALLYVDRAHFVPLRYQKYAYEDRALSLFDNQTISQPLTVVLMLELLNVKRGQKVLDIGAGSGWVTALLSYLVGTKGKVYAYEINRDVGKFGQERLLLTGVSFMRVSFEYKIMDYRKESYKYSPYDRIISGAAFKTIPKELLDQLAKNGRLVAPTLDYKMRVVNRVGDKFKQSFLRGFSFSFVPIV